MSCGPLNALLTSSVDSQLLGPSLTGLYENQWNPKVASVPLNFKFIGIISKWTFNFKFTMFKF